MARPNATQNTTTQTPFVALQTDEGFRVYSPADPKTSYQVTGSADAPRCTCPEFQSHASDPAFRCEHVRAVESQLPAGAEDEDEAFAREERLAIQEESNGTARQEAEPVLTLPRAQMMIKRSVSQDGRIDSLSIELSRLLDGDTPDEVRSSAERMMALQEEIVGRFMAAQHSNGNGNGNGAVPADVDARAVDARLLGIAGMNTRWGWRLFMNVQVNGDTVKMFGKTDALAEAIRAAGFPDMARQPIADGMKLDLPCRVVTSMSGDGRYTQIDRVLPANGGRPR